jgi:hypothetical protein
VRQALFGNFLERQKVLKDLIFTKQLSKSIKPYFAGNEAIKFIYRTPVNQESGIPPHFGSIFAIIFADSLHWD